SAIAINNASYNVSRAIGPAIGGLAIAAVSIALPFWCFCVGNLAVVAALLWWRAPRKAKQSLPAERLFSAVRTGLRYAMNNRDLDSTLIRAVAFFPFASAYWALLPLVARAQIGGGPNLYGVLLGVIGAGAVAGAFLLPWAKARLGADRLMALGALGQALAMVLYGFAREPLTAVAASAVAGASWIGALATLSVSAQVALPDWVRARGLALYTTVFFGCLTLGSAAWGEVAVLVGLANAHFLAAAGAVAAIALTWRWKLQTGAGLDLSPSMHWPAPLTAQPIENDRGPVLVTVEYLIAPEEREPFLEALARLEHGRRRDGAYAWGVFEDAAHPGRVLETFLIESWMEHLRQHERVTKADRLLQEEVRRFDRSGNPKVTHFIAADI
ncbi:MAG: MFS transporter, partial [Xanthobacteraceae bacterium]